MQILLILFLTVIILYIWGWFAEMFNYIRHGIKTGNWKLFVAHIAPNLFVLAVIYVIFSLAGC